MKLEYYHGDDLFSHPCRPDHPERPHRLHAALSGVLSLDGVVPFRRLANPAGKDIASLLHDPEYLERISEFLHSEEFDMLDGGDTMRTATSYSAAMTTLGSACTAVDQLADGNDGAAMILGRPAGHHACRGKGMGFCLIGTAAVAAKYGVERYGMRVAVLDFDLHHGNGTQDLLWNEPDVFFASSHEIENWPMSGQISEVGAHGQIMNAPLHQGTGSHEARGAWSDIFRTLEAFTPDMIIVSAGFDAHSEDPLSGLKWTLDDYEWLGQRISDVADKVCQGRVVTILEGGYNLGILRSGLQRYLSGLLGAKRSDTFADVILDGEASPYFKGSSSDLRKGSGLEVVKRHRRMWICDAVSGDLLYTPPSFVSLRSRMPLHSISAAAGDRGSLTIGQLIELETSAGS